MSTLHSADFHCSDLHSTNCPKADDPGELTRQLQKRREAVDRVYSRFLSAAEVTTTSEAEFRLLGMECAARILQGVQTSVSAEIAGAGYTGNLIVGLMKTVSLTEKRESHQSRS
jgi:hypothetical protein